MKVFLILVVFMAVVSSPVMHGLDFAIGPKLGLNFGWVGGSDFNSALRLLDDLGQARTSARVGFTGGLFITVGLIEQFAIQTELLFSSVGGRYEYTFTGVEVDGVQSALVLEIPLFLKPRIPAGAGAVYLLFGPEAAIFLTDITTEEEGGGITTEVDVPPDNSVVFVLAGGLGYEVPAGLGKLSFEIRYSRSFTEIFEDFDSHLRVLTIMVGYGFDQ